MTRFCDACHQPILAVVRWKALEVREDPLTAYWQGKRIIGLTRQQLKILHTMALRGRAGFESLVFHQSMDADPAGLKVQVSRIRTLFQHEEIPIGIKAVRGWGWMLELIDEPALAEGGTT